MKKDINWKTIENKLPVDFKTDPIDNPYGFFGLTEFEQKRLLQWCCSLGKIKRINNKFSSYGLKHVYERSANGGYVTNGQFKGAMLIVGFDIDNAYDKNWCFNVKTKDIHDEEIKNVRLDKFKVDFM